MNTTDNSNIFDDMWRKTLRRDLPQKPLPGRVDSDSESVESLDEGWSANFAGILENFEFTDMIADVVQTDDKAYEKVREILSFGVHVLSFFQQTTDLGVKLWWSQTALLLAKPEYVKIAFGAFRSMFGFEAQSKMGLAEGLSWMRKNMDAVAHSPLLKRARQMLIVMIRLRVHTLFSDKEPEKLTEWLAIETPEKNDIFSIWDLAQEVLDHTIWAVNTWEAFMKTGRFSILFSGQSSADSLNADYMRAKQELSAALTYDSKVFDFAHWLGVFEKYLKEHEMLRDVARPWEKVCLDQRIKEILSLIGDIKAKMATMKVRPQPFSLMLYGDSSIGKSRILNMLNSLILKLSNTEEKPGVIAFMNDLEAFDSNLFSYTKIVVMDDLGNRKDNIKSAPHDTFLKLVNETPFVANKAGVEEKGKVPIAPIAVMVTTNFPDAGCHNYTKAPLAFCRRTTQVVPTVNELYRKKGSFMIDEHKASRAVLEGKCDEIWTFAVNEACEAQSSSTAKQRGSRAVDWRPVEFRGRPAVDLKWSDLILYVKDRVDLFQRKKVSDTKLDDIYNHFTDSILKNDIGLPPVEIEYEEWSGSQGSYDEETISTEQYNEYATLPHPGLGMVPIRPSQLELECQNGERQRTPWFHHLMGLYWSNDAFAWTADHVLNVGRGVRHFFAKVTKDNRLKRIRELQMYCFTVAMTVAVYPLLPASLFAYCGWLTMCTACTSWTTALLADKYARLVPYPVQAAGQVVRRYRREITVAGWSIGVIVLVLKLFKYSLKAQGNFTSLYPKTDEEVDEAERQTFTWTPPSVMSEPTSEKGKTSCFSALEAKIKKNSVVFTFGGAESYGLFVCTNWLLIPKHTFDKIDYFEADVTDVCGSVAKAQPFRQSSAYFFNKGLDACLIQVNLGSRCNLIPYFVDSEVEGSFPGYYVSKDKTSTCFVEPKVRSAHAKELSTVFKVKTHFDTYVGLCGTALVNGRCGILGIHVAGRGKEAGVVPVLRRDLESIIVVGGPSYSLPHDETEDLDPQAVVNKEEPHFKSATRFVEGKNYTYFGRTTGMATDIPRVKPTPIAEVVKEHVGLEHEYGSVHKKGSDGKKIWQYQVALEGFASPGARVDSKVLELAVKDWKSGFTWIPRKLMSKIRPLTLEEVLFGNEELRFIDRMNFSTSAHPLPGKKKDYLAVEGTTNLADVDPVFLEGFHQALERLERGQRLMAPFKACTKEEVTKLTKDKKRIFSAVDLWLGMAIRMFYTPPARTLQMTTLKSEVAVGMNALGPQWQELYNHLVSVGNTNRVIEADYKSWDQRLPPCLIEAAFKVLYDLAEMSGNYDARDLRIMKTLAYDVIYPVVQFNGDLLEFRGGNPSGQNLTSVINSIANAFLLRIAFFKNPDHEDLSFRDWVSAVFYGDDVLAVVREGVEFDFFDVKRSGEEHSLGVTPGGDKNAEPTAYISMDKATFVKRRFEYHPELRSVVAPLDVESIKRRLVAHIPSKETSVQSQMYASVDSSMVDMAYHGREAFVEFQGKMITALDSMEDKTYINIPAVRRSYEDTIEWIRDHHYS